MVSPAAAVDELVNKMNQMTKGMSQERKRQWLMDFLAKWAPGQQRMNLAQFRSALGSLNINKNAGEVCFDQLDCDHNGFVDINGLCQVVLNPSPPTASSRQESSAGGQSYTASVRSPMASDKNHGSLPSSGHDLRSSESAQLQATGRSSQFSSSRQLQMDQDAGRLQATIRPEMLSASGSMGSPPMSAQRQAYFSPSVVSEESSVSGQPLDSRRSQNSGYPGDYPSQRSAGRNGYDAGSQDQRSQRSNGGYSSGGYSNGGYNNGPMRGSPNGRPPQQRSPPPCPPKLSRQPPTKVDMSELLLGQFRKLILARGGSHGIHSLGRTFRIMDSNHNERISFEELQNGLGRYGLRMSGKDLDLVMKAIDTDGTGKVSFDEFMVAVRGPINSRRMALINQAFDVLDKNGNGIVEVDDIAAAFNVKHHPDVMAGDMSPEHALNDFLDQFDGVDHDGRVDRKEFAEYYKNVSASIDSDDYFELMIRNAWHISGGQGWCENTANKRVLVTFGNGTQKVVELVSDLGLDLKSQQAVRRQLEKQGLKNIVHVQMNG